MSAMIIVAKFLRAKAPNFVYGGFITLTFILLLIQLVDLPLVRILDMTVWYAFDWLPEESFDNFVEMLSATTLSWTYWLGVAAFFAGVILSCYFFYLFLNVLSKKTPFLLSMRRLLLTLLCFGLFMLSWDLSLSRFTDAYDFNYFRRALPWKTTLLPSNQHLISFDFSIPARPEEEDCLRCLHQIKDVPTHRPNIFLFITESVRDDFITKEITPHLAQFKKNNVSYPMALSAANCSAQAWFSTFHSKYPFYWGHTNAKNWESGSLPLKHLKNNGYKIHLITSAHLSFYQMDELLFGKECGLLDSNRFFPHGFEKEAWQSDKQVFDQIRTDLEQQDNKQGQCFIVFLDSTHFNYSWPRDRPMRFEPVAENINYIKATFLKEGLEEIKNRYRNALNYIDELFGQFQADLKSKKLWDESVIVFAGDHGEEFYEKRNLFHAGDLSDEQIHIALYYKFGLNKRPINQQCKITSQVDIFPSILDYIFKKEQLTEILDGQSIFSPQKLPFALCGRINASRAPYEYCLHNGEHKLVFQFPDEKNLFKPQKVRILSLKNTKDESIPFNRFLIENQFATTLQTRYLHATEELIADEKSPSE